MHNPSEIAHHIAAKIVNDACESLVEIDCCLSFDLAEADWVGEDNTECFNLEVKD